ncbi:alpha/beta hydrolase [Mycobacterium sp.]|uniref:alpha/beta fold hydrolase n=1 Tax=Mycobacterium sp. TaxID=1785 RepID=UPI002D5D0017|nr:alpha/beta hydrolase [Mycobacterium sp.]HZA11287.1 alpha/beta hydrolase [Mycobacterium sp.]
MTGGQARSDGGSEQVSEASYVLIPGAGGNADYWQWVVPHLRAAGCDVIPVDLPADDDSAGLAAYRDRVCEAAADVTGPLILVAQSMGGFTAPLVADRRRTDLIVLLNAMVPAPGESGGQWWHNTGQQRASAEYMTRIGLNRTKFDFIEDFFHDVPADVKSVVFSAPEPRQSDTPFDEPWPLSGWPSVPTRFLQATDDRMFPVEFQRRVVRERLGLDIDTMPGGHLVALSRPREVAERLEDYRREAGL